MQANKFQDFDFGLEGNMKEYGLVSPPELDSSKVIEAGIPIALFIAKGDMTLKSKD